VAGGGAFLSTPADLVRLGSAMLKPGLLRAETIAAFRTPTRLVSGASTTYALGWTVKSVQLAGEPARIVSHRGSPAGGTVSLLTFPDLGLAIAAAANVTDARGVDPFARQVAEAFTRHQAADPAPGTERTRPLSTLSWRAWEAFYAGGAGAKWATGECPCEARGRKPEARGPSVASRLLRGRAEREEPAITVLHDELA
jgi:CubicO group peptidase (beta-lactamase class C family)